MSYTEAERQQLLQIARESIRCGLEKGKPCAVKLKDLPAALREKRASFVTLHKAGKLRGCIGTISAYQPLAEDVAQRAYAAAFGDSRFSPVRADELAHLDISISVLSPPEPLEFTSEADLLAKIQPQVDGLIIEEDSLHGVFLPSVWESLPNKREFLRQLKRKAGLPADYWSDAIKVSRFCTEYLSC
jgi:AmmeMemoRadiSam system protein A